MALAEKCRKERALRAEKQKKQAEEKKKKTLAAAKKKRGSSKIAPDDGSLLLSEDGENDNDDPEKRQRKRSSRRSSKVSSFVSHKFHTSSLDCGQFLGLFFFFRVCLVSPKLLCFNLTQSLFHHHHPRWLVGTKTSS
jgi:hypothetical protein